jgi:peptidoglycan/xylan/chitin deacetylase (PgdA/CDA1 family)
MRRPLAVFVLTAVCVSTASAAAAEDIAVAITEPADGVVVAGVVTLAAETVGDVSSVAFDWSSDGSTWTPIATDTQPADGWAAEWDTAGYSGTAVIRATASDGSSTASDSVTVEVNNSLEIVTVVSRPAFSPNGDGRVDTTAVNVTLDVPAVLSVEVVNPQGVLVRELAGSVPVEAGTTQLTWDGTDSSGQTVPDGAYAFAVEAVDGAGNGGAATAGVVVDTRQPVFALRRIAPQPMRSIGPVRFSFRIRDRSSRVRVSYVITNVAGVIVVRAGAVEMRSGRATLSWNGRTGRGPAPPGLYHVRFVVGDGAGNVRKADPAPFRSERPVHTTAVREVPGAKGLVALTFDDCYSASAWGRILSILAARHARASFFCSGMYVTSFPELARRTVVLGETVGAHGWNHPNMTTLGKDEIRRQLVSDANAWWQAARATPVPWFRPPYGSYDADVLSAASEAGYLHTVLWSVDPQDWRRPGASSITARVLSAAGPGDIVVLHTLDQTASALPAIIDGLRARGLEPVSLAALIAAG